MVHKLKQARKHILYAITSNVIFGSIYYFTFSWLAGYSLLYAYFGSLALIFLGLELDKYLKRTLVSSKTILEIKSLPKEDQEKNYRLLEWMIESFVSFKTILFVFYFFVVVVSQIVMIAPTLVSESLNNFLTANSYGIVLLMAIDIIRAQFSQDREEMKGMVAVLRRAWEETEK